MKQLTPHLLATALVLGAALAPALLRAQAAQPAPATDAAAADYAQGEVRRIDKEAGKVTLRHGEIKSLDMPPMTMVFRVTDTAALDKLKVGDKVRFKAANPGGAYTVTDIQPAP